MIYAKKIDCSAFNFLVMWFSWKLSNEYFGELQLLTWYVCIWELVFIIKVWCGLTSEGQLIAVKQIELNTSDKDKAKREYEKVQEEVDLLKLLNHKNIVGWVKLCDW